MEHAHRNLIVHRDLKSGNILVTAEGVPKLLDFGIAKLLLPSAADGTHEGSTVVPTLVALTPEYASPEQLRGERVTTATDVYSLGVLLYELLAGQRPFPTVGGRVEDLSQLVRDTDPPTPSEVVRARDWRDAQRLRGDLDTIVMMAMHMDIVRRYESVAQLSEDIQRHQQARGAGPSRSVRLSRHQVRPPKPGQPHSGGVVDDRIGRRVGRESLAGTSRRYGTRARRTPVRRSALVGHGISLRCA